MGYAGESGRSEAVGGNTPKTAGNNEVCNCKAKGRIIKYNCLFIYLFRLFITRKRICLTLQVKTWQ